MGRGSSCACGGAPAEWRSARGSLKDTGCRGMIVLCIFVSGDSVGSGRSCACGGAPVERHGEKTIRVMKGCTRAVLCEVD